MKLSGVVTSAVGKRLLCRARNAAGVSPVRDSSVHGSPRSLTGAASASTRVGGERAERRDPEDAQRRCCCAGFVLARVRVLSPSPRDSSSHSSSGPHHAASVFPVPVAAWIKPALARRYARHTSR